MIHKGLAIGLTVGAAYLASRFFNQHSGQQEEENGNSRKSGNQNSKSEKRSKKHR